MHIINNIDIIELMEKPFDRDLSRMSKNQLVVLRALLAKPERIMTTYELAKKSGIVEKQLGGVLSAMTRKRIEGIAIVEIMGRDSVKGLRFRLNSKAITTALADKQVRMLISSYK